MTTTERQSDRLIIVGSSAQSLGKFTYDRESFQDAEVWGLNNLFSVVTVPTRWFEIHRIWEDNGIWYRRGKAKASVSGEESDIETYLKKLDSLDIPVYMHEKNSLVKRSEEFPFKDCLDSFPFHYYTCTMAWQVALAILMDFKRIEFHGMELLDYWERRYQRACLSYWIGVAVGQGIDVRVNLDSNFMRGPFLYGFEMENEYE